MPHDPTRSIDRYQDSLRLRRIRAFSTTGHELTLQRAQRHGLRCRFAWDALWGSVRPAILLLKFLPPALDSFPRPSELLAWLDCGERALFAWAAADNEDDALWPEWWHYRCGAGRVIETPRGVNADEVRAWEVTAKQSGHAPAVLVAYQEWGARHCNEWPRLRQIERELARQLGPQRKAESDGMS